MGYFITWLSVDIETIVQCSSLCSVVEGSTQHIFDEKIVRTILLNVDEETAGEADNVHISLILLI